MRNRILRGAAFILLLLVMIWALGFVFEPKDNSSKSGLHELLASGLLAEPEQTLDVVFLGDSEAYCAFMPLGLWEKTGITSYVCSTVDQKPYETEHYLKNAFREQSPKIVIVETNVFYRSFPKTELISYQAEELSPLLRYHDRWKSLKMADWFSNPDYTHVQEEKGFYYSIKIKPANAKRYMKPSRDLDPIPGSNSAYIKSFRDYCAERGAQLILVSSPSTENWDYKRHNAMEAAAQELGIPYLDMNLMTEEIPIDWKTDTRDKGDHLNYYGAVKVTDYLCGYLTETGLFTDKRNNPDFADWNEYLNAFREVLKKDGVI